MKNKIVYLLKNSSMVYKIYSFVFNIFFKILRIFIKTENDVILINSFGGKKYDDSPKVIFEYMKTKEKYDKYKIYWAFDNQEKFEIEKAEKIKTNSLKYFIIALKAKYWITNS